MASNITQAAYLAESRQTEVYATHTVAFVLALVAVGSRFYTATRVAKRALEWHDWLALGAGVGSVGVFACSMLWMRFGLGRHAAWALQQDPRNVKRFLQTIMANELLYTTTLALARMSLVVFYYHIFGLTNMRYWLHFVVGFIAAWSLSSYIPSIFTCWPISDFWETEGNMHHCIDLYALYTAIAIGSIATDFLLIVLPLPYIWSLRTSIGRRILTGMLFVFGGMNCFITIIRVLIVLKVDMTDPTYNTVDLMIWTGLELYSATFCCCLPALPPLFRHISKRCGLTSLFSTSAGTGGGRGGVGKKFSGSTDFSATQVRSIGRITSRPKRPPAEDTLSLSEFDKMPRDDDYEDDDDDDDDDDYDDEKTDCEPVWDRPNSVQIISGQLDYGLQGTLRRPADEEEVIKVYAKEHCA